MHWKLERDPFYSKLTLKYGEKYAINAGFVYDSSKESFDVNASLDIECTPYHFLKEELKTAKKPCVLLSTGSFSPFHEGHLNMMKVAKEKLNSEGWDVIGGYIAPDNDEYIKAKLDFEAIPIHYRIQSILDMIKKETWLTVDPWMGIFRKEAINFTENIYRLERYLEKYLGQNIPVFFVCGMDNAKFVKTFTLEGNCVLIGRNTYNSFYDEVKDLIDDERIYFAPKNDNHSSTAIRKSNAFQTKVKEAIIRVDVNPEVDKRTKKILQLLNEQFDNVEVKYVKDQINDLYANFASSDNDSTRILNLDPLVWGFFGIGHDIDISRLYDKFGLHQLGFTERPENLKHSEELLPRLQEVIDKLDKSRPYILFDDDIHTGSTMKYVTNLLKENGVNVYATMSFTKSLPYQEIIDTRDFKFNKDFCGLVIAGDEENKRYPYVYPFTCPFIRSSINNPMEFSKKIWQINLEYFIELNDKESIDECMKNIRLLNDVCYE